MKFGFLFLVMAFSLMGCSESPYKTTPVSGVLKCQGQPVAGVFVVFSPKAGEGRTADKPGRPGTAMTDEEGRFVLSTFGKEDGAVIGTHSVSVSLNEDPNSAEKSEGAIAVQPCLSKTIEIEVERGMAPLTLDLSE